MAEDVKPKIKKNGRKVPPVCALICRDFVTENYACHLFHVSKPGLELWKREYGLPHVVIPGDKRAAVRYDLNELLRWAEEYGRKTFKVPLHVKENVVT
jgi:hypothetical protein